MNKHTPMVILRNRLLVFRFFYLVKLWFGFQSIQFRFKMFILRKIIFRLLLFDIGTRSSSLIDFETECKLWHNFLRICNIFFPVWVFRNLRQLINFQKTRNSIGNYWMLFFIMLLQLIFVVFKPLTTILAKFMNGLFIPIPRL